MQKCTAASNEGAFPPMKSIYWCGRGIREEGSVRHFPVLGCIVPFCSFQKGEIQILGAPTVNVGCEGCEEGGRGGVERGAIHAMGTGQRDKQLVHYITNILVLRSYPYQ